MWHFGAANWGGMCQNKHWKACVSSLLGFFSIQFLFFIEVTVIHNGVCVVRAENVFSFYISICLFFIGVLSRIGYYRVLGGPPLVHLSPCWSSVLHVICNPNYLRYGFHTSVPFGNHKFVFEVCEIVLFCQLVPWCKLLDSTYKWCHMTLVFLILTYVT